MQQLFYNIFVWGFELLVCTSSLALMALFLVKINISIIWRHLYFKPSDRRLGQYKIVLQNDINKVILLTGFR